MLFCCDRLLLLIFIFFSIQCVGSWNFNLPKLPKLNSYNPYCHFRECCNADWIKFDRGRLRRNLTDRVYGQPLLETAVDALSAHFNPYFPPHKALTLSFHGMTGTGKNYVSKFIIQSMFSKGSASKYVHHFIGRMHFAEVSKLEEYKLNLYSWLRGNVSDCPKQLFIFDEVDKMVPEVLDGLKPFIDYRDEVDGVSYSQVVFIFLSNTGADIINEHFHDLYITEGKSREDLSISDFETFIQAGAFNEKGGFHHCDPIKNNLIDHYIPFLPLEEKHVIMCIKDEFRYRKVENPTKEHIEEVMKFIEWGPDSSRKFSKTGCKRLGQKVAVLVDKHYPQYHFQGNDEL